MLVHTTNASILACHAIFRLSGFLAVSVPIVFGMAFTAPTVVFATSLSYCCCFNFIFIFAFRTAGSECIDLAVGKSVRKCRL